MFCWFQTNDARMAHTTTSRHIADHGTESFLKKYLDGSVKFILGKFCVFFLTYRILSSYSRPCFEAYTLNCEQVMSSVIMLLASRCCVTQESN